MSHRFPERVRNRKLETLLAALLLPLGLLLASCAPSDPEAAGIFCPDFAQVQDAARLVRFDGAGRDLTDVLFEARLQDVEMGCSYDDDENEIEAALKVTILAARGPADSERLASFRYFVAIATNSRQVVAREEFDLSIPFEGNRTQLAAVEELTPRIPLKPGQDGSEYKVFVGLVLTPAELEYNRANR